MHRLSEALSLPYSLFLWLGIATAFVMAHSVGVVALLSISRTFLSFSNVAPSAIVAFSYGLTGRLRPGLQFSEVRWLHYIHVVDLGG